MSSKSKRLTTAQWEAVKTKWELGTHTLQMLSDEYGISLTAIKAGLNKRGAKRGSRSHEVAEETAEQQKSERQRVAEQASRMKEKFLKYNDAIASIAMRKLMKQQADGKNLEGIKGEMETLRKAVAVISTARDENFHLLGLYKDDVSEEDLPEIVVSEMTAAELEAIQKSFDKESEVALSSEEEAFEEEPDLPFEDEEEDEDGEG